MTIQSFSPQIVPLSRWKDGSIRVGQTRVLLDLIVAAFNMGQTPEEIVISYSSLKLSDVYATIGYYLDNKEQVDAYIQGREQESDAVWDKIDADPNQISIRQRLLSQR